MLPSPSPQPFRGLAPGRDRTQAEGEPVAALVTALVHTDGVNRLLCMALPEMLRRWAGKSRFKQAVTGRLSGYLVKVFSAAGGTTAEPDPLDALLANPDFVRSLSERFPALLKSLTGSASTLAEALGMIPVDGRVELIRKVLREASPGDAARILNAAALWVSEVHEQDPTLFSEAARPGLRELIHALDFGQLKETVDRAQQDVVAAAAVAGEELWQYPAKIVCLLSLLPSLANIAVRSLAKTTAPTRGMAPDLLADVLASLLREIDGAAVGELVNELAELARRVHTGSVLIGDPGSSQLPKQMEELAGAVLTTLDVPLLLKAAGLLDDLKQASAQALSTALEEEPALAKAAFLRPFRAVERHTRTWSHRVDAWDSRFTDEELAAYVSQATAYLSGEDLADTVNRFCRLLNRADAHTPAAGKNVLSRFIASLDPVEVGETARRLAGDLVEELKPMAPDIVPPLLRGAAALLSAAEEEGGKEFADALAALKTSFNGKEALP